MNDVPDAPPASEDLPQAIGEAVGEFLRVFGIVKRFGLDAWKAMQSGREIDERLPMMLAMLDAELDALDFEADVRDAVKDAAERKAR